MLCVVAVLQYNNVFVSKSLNLTNASLVFAENRSSNNTNLFVVVTDQLCSHHLQEN